MIMYFLPQNIRIRSCCSDFGLMVGSKNYNIFS